MKGRFSAEQTAFQGDREAPWIKARGVGAVLASWQSQPRLWSNIVLDHQAPARDGAYSPFHAELAPGILQALRQRGLSQLYSHQARAFELARAGTDVVIATPTASGKSLCFNLPVMDRMANDAEARAIYLFPTKALARDQEEALRALMTQAGIHHGAITYDGDTPGDARRAARERAGVLLTNPDMLHSGILPHHASWSRLFSNLRFVVLDELHTYRGVFGSHLANVLRRLWRVARFHGSNPTFIFASATIGNPQEHASRMLGREVAPVGENGAPSGSRRILLYNPPVFNPELGIRESYIKAASRLTADLVRAQIPTVLFGQSRNSVEMMLKYLRDHLAEDRDIPPESIQGYRGGYLPGTRRAIESGLRGGEVRCVVSTNALELGIDIGALDAVVCAGYPGSVAGLWQRFGRAGRRGGESLSLLVASSAPLDQFVAASPEYVTGAPIEQARIDPDNVEILIQHLKCASFELPFEQGEGFRDVSAEATNDALEFLAQNRVLHPVENPAGRKVFHWATDAYPANHVSLRSVGWDNYVIIDLEGSRTLAEMDWRSVHTMLHEQAIYQHDGEQYQVEKLDYENHKAYVRKVEPDYFTTAMSHFRISVIEQEKQAALGTSLQAALGEVSVVEKVVGYKKIKFHTHENVGHGEVALPEIQMHTVAMWLTVPEDVVRSLGIARPSVIDSLRGILNALHTAACVGLMIDPRDLGRSLGSKPGVGDDDVPAAAGTGMSPLFDPTLFLFDQIPGGIGLAPRLFDERESLLRRARALLEGCQCEGGCPACIGPEIGEGEPTRRKQLALQILSHVGIQAIS